MSFIFEDQDLISQLLQSGAGYELQFTKRGQAATQAEQQASMDYTNMQALLKNLQREITPPATDQDDAWAGLPPIKSSNMDSLGDFIEWLNANNVRNVVVPAGEQGKPGEGFFLAKIEPGTKIVVPMVQNDPNARETFWINMDALRQYLTYLLGVTKKLIDDGKPNVLFSVQLSKLIQDANRHLFQTPMSEQYQVSVPDNTQLDMLPNPLDPKNQGGQGAIPFYYKDLKDFNSFCKKSNIGWTDKKLTMNTAPDKFDICGAINVLFYRATYLNRTASNDPVPNTKLTEKQLYSAYLAGVQKMAQGMNCSLTGGAGGSGASSGGEGATSGAQVQAALSHILSAGGAPLSLDSIDFNRINTYFEQLSQLVGGSAAMASVPGIIESTKSMMQQASGATQNKLTVFGLGVSPQTFANYIGGPTPGQTYLPLIRVLDQIVDNVASSLNALRGAYRTQIEGTPAWEQVMGGQIGRYENDNSIYQRNVVQLRTLASAVQMSQKPTQ
jgi:hypothetical protein